MNWLAHLHLASLVKADAAGSLLPDIINTRHLYDFAPDQQYAISLHQAIDHFTDTHAIVKRSKQRITPPFTRFSGVLIDIFYDYCLSRSWEYYSSSTLPHFIQSTHQALESTTEYLTAPAPQIIKHLIEQEWLKSYQTFDGLELSLQRVARRFKRPIDLGSAVENLKLIEPELLADFNQFYPELITHTQLISKDLPLKVPN
jgi:acyl carrier protein phosphodiesterase